jgi:hypothetical protein
MDEFDMLALLDDIEQDEEENRRHLLTQAAAALVVSGVVEKREALYADRREKRLYLTRGDLLEDPRGETPWQAVLRAGNDRAFITLMGFDVATFHSILDDGFRECWDNFAIPRSDTNTDGHPRLGGRSLDAEGALALALHYLNSTMSKTTLCQIFALTPSTVSRYIDFSLKILVQALRIIPSAAIRWPRAHEFEELSDIITARHSLLTGAFGFIDGLNLPVGVVADPDLANAYYNGWLKDHVCSSVVAFSAKGKCFLP